MQPLGFNLRLIKMMGKKIPFYLGALITLHLHAQTVVITGNSSLCIGQSITLHADVSAGTIGTTSYNFEIIDYSTHPPFSGGTSIDQDFTGCTTTAHDDCWAGGTPPDHSGYPIGFSFCFFNQQYTRFYVGSNGWIGFTDPTGHSWTTWTATVIPPTNPPYSPSNPNPNVPKNCIFAPWQDWYPGADNTGNCIFYYTTGTEPNRKLVVYWLNCPLFGCQSSSGPVPPPRGSFMIVLNEQTSIVENFLQSKPQCPNSTEGSTQGVLNLEGNIAFTATGRNYAVWTAYNEGTRFTPSGVKWYRDALPPSGTLLGYGPDLVVTPTSTTTYYAVVGTCNGGTAYDFKTVTVHPLPPNPNIVGEVTVCQGTTWEYSTNSGMNSYLWTANIGDILSTSNNTALIQWNSIGNQSVNVTFQSIEGCSPAQQGTMNVNVIPFETPVISGNSEVCEEDNASFTTQNGKSNYLWSYPGATYISGGGTNENVLTVKWETPGLHYVYVNYTDPGGCTSNPPTSKEVLVHPKPLPVITGNTSICLNEQNSTYSTEENNLNYLWHYSPDATYISGQGTNSITLHWNVLGPQWVDVTYTNNHSCTGSSPAFSLLVNPLPTATISGNNAVCQNAPEPMVTFTGASATAPYTFTYNINGGSPQTVTTSSGNSVSVAVPTNTVGTFTYNLLSVQDGSTTACSQAQTGSATIVVNPLPTANISGSTAVCQNATAPQITFTGASATAPYTFTYNINGGSPQTVTTSSGNSVSVAVPTNTVGTFTYNLLSVQDGSTTACSQAQTGSATIVVNPLPTATISGNTAVCQNATAPQITFTGASATAPYTFTYNINGGSDLTVTTTSGNSVSVAVPTNTVGTFTYTLLSVQDGSTTACSQAQTGSATVVVRPLPTATISGTIAVCQNASEPMVTFTGASATAPYTFTYNINGGSDLTVTTTSGNSVSVAVPTNTVGSFNYNLIRVRDASTTSCVQDQGGTATVTVNPLPTATISGSTQVCQNLPSPLITFTGNAGTSPYTFTYNLNGGSDQLITTVAGNSVTLAVPTSVLGTFTYNLISVRDGSSTQCSQSQSGNASIIVNDLPTPTISGTLSVCDGDIVDYSTETGAESYSWIIPPAGHLISGGGVHDPTVRVQWLGPGTYNISVNYIIGTGCTAAQPTVASVTVNALPSPVITGPTPICGLSQQNYTVNPIVSGHTYNWTVTGGSIQWGQTGSTVSVMWGNNPTANLNLVETIHYSGASCSAPAPQYTVTLNPWPVAAGDITGPDGVCKTWNNVVYTVPYILNSESYLWNYTGSGATLVNNGNTISMSFAANATSGELSVRGVNTCGQGPLSPVKNIQVNSLPVVSLPACFDVVTTTNAKSFLLKGGTPLGAGGKYYINTTEVAGNVLNPATLAEGSHTITFTYTDANTCQATATRDITVLPSNANFQCVNGLFTDPRNTDPATNKYPTFPVTANGRTSCWMMKNLNWGTYIASSLQQTDNCVVERYCPPNDNTCSSYGSLFQWDELMQYGSTPGWSKGVCPPGWHVPTAIEWQDLIDAYQGNGIAAGALKDLIPATGFRALLNGMYFLNSQWVFTATENMKASMYWTSTTSSEKSLARGINIFNPSVSLYESSKSNAFPVRCVKD